MNSSAEDIKDWLKAQGISPVYVSKEPTEPDNCVTVYDTGGFEPQVGTGLHRPTIQVKVRNRVYKDGFALAENIKTLLHGNKFTQGDYRYIGIWAMSDVAFLGYDSNSMALLTVNFRIQRTTTA